MIRPVACRTFNGTTGFFSYHNRSDISGVPVEKLYSEKDVEKLITTLCLIKESGVIPSHYNGIDITSLLKDLGI